MIGDVGFEWIFDSLEDIVPRECFVQLIDAFGGGFAVFGFQSPAAAMVDRFACISEKVIFFDFHDHTSVITLNSETEGFTENG